jgi:hypothetical protein
MKRCKDIALLPADLRACVVNFVNSCDIDTMKIRDIFAEIEKTLGIITDGRVSELVKKLAKDIVGERVIAENKAKRGLRKDQEAERKKAAVAKVVEKQNFVLGQSGASSRPPSAMQEASGFP